MFMSQKIYTAKKFLAYNLTESHYHNKVQKLQALMFIISLDFKIWKCACTWKAYSNISFYFFLQVGVKVYLSGDALISTVTL